MINTQHSIVTLMYQSSRSFNIPPGATLRAFEFLENFCSNPPSPGQKAPARASGGGAQAYFPNSGRYSSLENYCLYCKNNFNTFTYFKIDKSVLNTFKYRTKLVQAFGFQPIRHENAIFSFEFIKVLRRLRHDL